MKIGLIGGAGKMGEWIANYLSNHPRKFDLVIQDLNKQKGEKIAKETNAKFHTEYSDFIPEMDVVVVCVPIDSISKVIKEISPHMKEGSLLMDIGSVKTEPIKTMKQLKNKKISLIGTHPLFGPREKEPKNQNIVLVPIKKDKWFNKLKTFLKENGFNVEVMSAKDHDKKMAIIQGLTHFLVIVFGKTLQENGFNLKESTKFSTPTYQLFVENLKRVFVQNPKLYAQIQLHNPYTQNIHQKFLKEFKEGREYIKDENLQDLIDYISEGERLTEN
ncbi:MAG: Prephenate dehydrogenase TyrA [Candidatus Methanohalarchaeum thermophilum]|uniref:Prephenate dehydrogenase TyrA n=1 Tax=Methanohalarchaeum thermophilum TaxID=1903181 RepID=A0A1Q6DSK5_METT1|nr:MAG: Prephenate dehydrogenase TyrA [Candidatus Methanohalarchaeum thermophilum]